MDKVSPEEKLKILYVEDQEAIARLVEYKLSKEGIKVFLQYTGDGVLNKVIRTKPDLILLDLMLPVKDGLTILEELKGNEEVKNIPVIMLSIQGEEKKIEQAFKFGATDYIQKPFSTVELSARIHKALA
ncbi:response regulator [bacterium BMS3Abin03]|jgi:two-component system response regulator VicR|nr:response regulator [bacterium BMS3Abin03]